jgi:hypothetical protein
MVSHTSTRDQTTYSRAAIRSFGVLFHQLLEFTFQEGGSCSQDIKNPLLAPLQSFKSVLSEKLASLDSTDDMEFAHIDYAGVGPVQPHATPVFDASANIPPFPSGQSTPVPVIPETHASTPGTTYDDSSEYVDMDSSSIHRSPRASSKRPCNKKASNSRPFAPSSPSSKKGHKRRLLQDPPASSTVVIDVDSLQNIISTQFDAKFDTMKSDLKNEQSAQTDALKNQLSSHYSHFTKETSAIKDTLKDHDQRIAANTELTSTATSKLTDLSSRVVNLEELFRSWSSLPPGLSPSLSSQPNLSFSSRVDEELSARIAKAREFQAQNTHSFVVFSAKEHLDGKSPEVFAQRVATCFGGAQALVDKIAWLGIDKAHLKITVTLPLAEEIGAAYFRDRQTLRVAYGLAPCRTKLLREGIARLTKTLRPLRHLLPEILAERVSATSASFLGKDHFDAMDFLYPAIRLSTGQIIPVSHLVNNPDLPSLTLPVDPNLVIPGPTVAK